MPKYEAREFESHPLHVGDLEVQSYLALDDDADNDLYVQALRTLGPLGIANRMPLAEWGWKPNETYGSMCDLCASIASIPETRERIRDYSVSTGLTSKMWGIRAALYGETQSDRATPGAFDKFVDKV